MTSLMDWELETREIPQSLTPNPLVRYPLSNRCA